jgi:hypothetical protein
MSLPVVLGIVAFVLASVATLLSYSVFQVNLVEQNIEASEEYVNSLQAVEAAINIIIRDQNTDSAYLADLASYMNVSIIPHSPTVWLVSSAYSPSDSVTSYLASNALDISTELFDEPYLTPLTLNTDVNPTSMLASFLPIYLENTFTGLTAQTDFNDFDAIVQYVDSLRTSGYLSTITTSTFASRINSLSTDYYVSGNSTLGNNRTVNITNTSVIYINGNLTLGNNGKINIEEGSLLVVDGTLTTGRQSSISGNIVVNNNVIINSTTSYANILNATLYIRGYFNMKIAKSLLLGNHRPTFILAEGNITFGNPLPSTATGYLYCDRLDVGSGTSTLYGGVYYTVSSDLPSNRVFSYQLDTALLYDYALPEYIPDPDAGTDLFRYTIPR